MDEYIRKQDAFDVLTDYYHHTTENQHMALKEALDLVPEAEDFVPISFHEKCVRYEIEKRIFLEKTIAYMKEQSDFLEFLYQVIQPNEMEQYRSMYRAQAVPSDASREES